MKAYSMDLRERIFAARAAGESTADVADQFGVSPAFVRRLLQRYRETGTLGPRAQARRGFAPVLDAHAQRLRELNAREPDLTPAEIRDRLRLTVAPLTVWRALRRLGLSFKKSPSARPSRTGRTSGPPATGGTT